MSLIERSFREKIILVGMVLPDRDIDAVEASLDELALLVDTAGADVMARVTQRRDSPDPATYVGSGKADELRELSLVVDSDTVVFDDELTPAQQRNLEKILGRTAIDRTAVILDIFAQNARTQEGRAQVELALLRYQLPRLRGKRTNLSQQSGGIGTTSRGAGETLLEVDRRRLQKRITALEAELIHLTATRRTQRKSRLRSEHRQISLVGYTNAGKSSLLNALAGADVLVEDRLFATLDPRTRRADLPGGETLLLSDTVGFVRKLPHGLVEAFKSTLEVVAEADLLVHVVDASAADPLAQIAAVHEVLEEIGAANVPELLVFNKIDLVPDAGESWRTRFEGSVAVSANRGDNIDLLKATIIDRLRAMRPVLTFAIPYDQGGVLAALHREGEVVSVEHTDEATIVRARLDQAGAMRYTPYAVN